MARFLLNREQEADRLREELLARTYRPGAGHAFRIHDPKPRSILALPFRDRVVQHLLIQATLPAVERGLVAQTYACRLGKGTHRCLLRAMELCRRHRHVLRVDVQKFFPSIDHEILRRLLLRTTPPPWRWLRGLFIMAPLSGDRADFHFPGDTLLTPLSRPHGLPIGSLTSQIWANVYLSPLDHLLASHLGLGDFVRYCDDLLIFHDDPDRLRAALQHLQDRADALRLRLHPHKTRLHRTTDTVPFLGFVLQRRGDGVRVRLRAENIARMRQRMRTVQALFGAGAVELEEVRSRLQAWQAHAQHGHTRVLVRRELRRLRFRRDED